MGIVMSLYDDFSDKADKIAGKYKKLEDISEASVTKLNAAVSGLKMGALGMAMGAAILLPFALGINKSIEFNAALGKLKAMSTATAAEMGEMRTQALDLGAVTQFTSVQIASAQTTLAKAGLKVVDVLKSMPAFASLAAAGQLDLAHASEIAVKTMSQFNIPAKQSAHVADVLAQTANSSISDVEDIAQSMKFFAPIASNFNVKIEEAGAVIGMLSNEGLEGSIATRAFSTALATLSHPTAQQTQMMHKLRFSMFNTRGEFIGLANMIDLLAQKTAGFTQQKKMEAVSTIFGSEALKQIMDLMNGQYKVMQNGTEVTLTGAAAMRQFTYELEHADGAAKRMSNTILDNLHGDLIILKSSINNMGIAIGSGFEPALRPLARGLTVVVNALTKFADTKIGQVLMYAAAATGLLIAGLGTLVVVTNLGRFAAAQCAIAFTAMGKAELAATFASRGLVAGIRAIGAAIWAALVPLLPIILPILGGLLLVYGAYKLLRGALTSFDEQAAKIADGSEKRFGWLVRLGGVVRGVIDIWRSWNGSTFQLTETVHNALEKMGLLNFVLNLGTWIVRLKEFLRGMKAGFLEAFHTIKAVISDVWHNYISPAFNQINDGLGNVGVGLGKNTTNIEKWHRAGEMVGKFLVYYFIPAVLILTVAMVSLAGSILLAFSPVLIVILAIVYAFRELKKLGDWVKETKRWSPELNNILTPWASSEISNDNPGRIKPNSVIQNQIQPAMINNSASYIMQDNSRAPYVLHSSDKRTEQINIPIFIGSDKLDEIMLGREKMDAARR